MLVDDGLATGLPMEAAIACAPRHGATATVVAIPCGSDRVNMRRAVRIAIAYPAQARAHTGNHVTVLRWRRLLRELGHRVQLTRDGDVAADLVVALHATRSARAVDRVRAKTPTASVVVALAGTDLYQDLPRDSALLRVLERAQRLVVLHPRALAALPLSVRGKARVILQSAAPPKPRPARASRHFAVAVVAHLRAVKDPFRAEEAARDLPASSRVRVVHAGGALEPGYAAEARRRASANPRYTWVGDRPRWQARRLIARSRLLVLSSRSEGGANVISEALVAGVPVLASRIACAEGLLGPRYPGLFPVGDTRALRRLLERAELEPAFLSRLRSLCRRRAALFRPARERQAWRALVAEL